MNTRLVRCYPEGYYHYNDQLQDFVDRCGFVSHANEKPKRSKKGRPQYIHPYYKYGNWYAFSNDDLTNYALPLAICVFDLIHTEWRVKNRDATKRFHESAEFQNAVWEARRNEWTDELIEENDGIYPNRTNIRLRALMNFLRWTSVYPDENHQKKLWQIWDIRAFVLYADYETLESRVRSRVEFSVKDQADRLYHLESDHTDLLRIFDADTLINQLPKAGILPVEKIPGPPDDDWIDEPRPPHQSVKESEQHRKAIEVCLVYNGDDQAPKEVAKRILAHIGVLNNHT